MSKFKIRFKIEKLELEVEGERESASALTNGLKHQLAGLLQAPASVLGVEEKNRVEPIVLATDVGKSNDGLKRKRRSRNLSSGEESASVAIDFRHDTEKWGAPKQDWTTAQKAMWLLYVVSNQTEHKELSYLAIAETFNKHFRQAKEIQKGNVGRDLGKAKLQSPSLVGEDTTKSPSSWYLTSEGEKTVQKLIAEPSLPLS